MAETDAAAAAAMVVTVTDPEAVADSGIAVLVAVLETAVQEAVVATHTAKDAAPVGMVANEETLQVQVVIDPAVAATLKNVAKAETLANVENLATIAQTDLLA